MRRMVVAAGLVAAGLCVTSAEVAKAQVAPAEFYGYIHIVSPVGAYCSFEEPAEGGLLTVWVECDPKSLCVHAVLFRIVTGGGFTGTYVGETINVGSVVTGNTQDGIYITDLDHYGPIVVATIQYMTDGTSAPCSWLQIAPFPPPVAGGVLIIDCGDQVYDVTEKSGNFKYWINGDTVDINCGWCLPLPVGTAPSTWGSIKALYTR